MKIAYCFACHTRTWKDCFPSFKEHILSQWPGDIFFHTWNEQTPTNPTWWKPEGAPKLPLSLAELLVAVRPKAYLVEESRALVPVPAESDDWLKRNAWSVKCAYESALKSFHLASAHGPYDTYFMLRFDILWENPAVLEELMDMEALYLPRHDQFNKTGNYSDVFSHGNEKFTRKRLDWFWHLEKNLFLNSKSDRSQEVEMSEYLKSMNLPIEISSLRYGLYRGKGKIQKFYETR